MRGLITIATILSLSAANAQIRWEKQPVIADSDPAAPALEKWQRGVEADYKKGGLIIPTFTSWFELPFDSLKTLFPGFRFFSISWSEVRAPGKDKENISLALGLETTLVCDAKGKLVKEVHHTGNYEAFGELLKAAKVAIRTEDDAKLVWEGFCDIHQRHWKEQPSIRIEDRKWHLGNKTIDRFHCYYEVLLDADFRVTSAKLR